MSDKIKYVFPSGTEIVGTIDELEKFAKASGVKLDYTKIGVIPKGYYPSESKGLVKISSMTDYHLRRALLKRAKDYYAEVYESSDTNKVFLGKFLNLSEDPIVVSLFTELKKRA